LQKNLEFQAADAYLSKLGTDLSEKYGLTQFQIEGTVIKGY
jgi:hypothetical protein